ncbi:MAG: hypothetical protein ACRD2A_19200 [Vicinamibacterales bacterium]
MPKQYAVDRPATSPETDEKFVKITWSDNGQHRVEVRGLRRRHDVERLLRAASRHCHAAQVRGLPIDTAETQRPKVGEVDADMSSLAGRGQEN